MGYSVRLADLGEARSAILPMSERELHWFYRDGPHGPGQAFVLHQGSDARTIGCAGLGVRSLWRGEHVVPTGLFADLAVAPTYRSALPALTLVRAVKQHADDHFGIGYGFPNQRAIAIYRRAGLQQLGLMRRYARPLRTASFLEKRIGRFARVVAPVVDRALAVSAALGVRAHSRFLRLSWLSDFDARFDRLWLEARLGYPLLCERTSAFLRWRFSRQVHRRDYRIAALSDHTTRLRAYAIVHADGEIARLVDLFGASTIDLDALLAHLLVALRRADCTSVEMRFLGTHRIPKLLEAHGFSRRADIRHVMVSLGSAMRDDAELRDVESWYLTDLDEDR